MRQVAICVLLVIAAVSLGCQQGRSAAPSGASLESMRLTTIDGNQVVALEYAVAAETGSGSRSVYLYDASTGDCLNVIHAPSAPGDQMLITHAPCK